MKIKKISNDSLLIINAILIIFEFLTLIIAVSANNRTSMIDILETRPFKPYVFIFPIVFSAIFLIINIIFSNINFKRIILIIISFIILISSVMNIDFYSDITPDDTMLLYGYEYDNEEYLNEISDIIDYVFPKYIHILSWEPDAQPSINKLINIISSEDKERTTLLSEIYLEGGGSVPSSSVRENKLFVDKNDILTEITVKLNVKYDCAVVYNKDLGTYNSYPEDIKHYNYIMITYSFDCSSMYVIEYFK